MNAIEIAVVSIVVAGAAAYLVRYVWRFWRGKATGCGCGTTACPATQKQPPAATPYRQVHSDGPHRQN